MEKVIIKLLIFVGFMGLTMCCFSLCYELIKERFNLPDINGFEVYAIVTLVTLGIWLIRSTIRCLEDGD